ncbi:MAG: hypothetical protein CL908_04360 [Deltaproteobacteria bacterium]|nr:hypothetical protein [Deltaproteobacteria bacterium]
MVRTITHEHWDLDALFARALSRPNEDAGERATHGAIEELREVLESHLSVEEDLYFPTIQALRTEYEGPLRSFICEHDRFRALLREITALMGGRKTDEAFRLLEDLKLAFEGHVAEEEVMLHSIDRKIRIDASDEKTFEHPKRFADVETRAGLPTSTFGRHGDRHGTGRRRVVRWVAGMAAVAAALILLPIVFPGLRSAGVEGPEALAGSILREIALNHSKNQGIQFAANDYSGLRQQMDELDFSMRSPQRIGGGEFRILGGRYCSLQGRPAAQIKLEDEAGQVLTLYQTHFSDSFEGLFEQRRELGGIQIRIWREGDLLFGLAGS